jgi:hypothetical protein
MSQSYGGAASGTGIRYVSVDGVVTGDTPSGDR